MTKVCNLTSIIEPCFPPETEPYDFSDCYPSNLNRPITQVRMFDVQGGMSLMIDACVAAFTHTILSAIARRNGCTSQLKLQVKELSHAIKRLEAIGTDMRPGVIGNYLVHARAELERAIAVVGDK